MDDSNYCSGDKYLDAIKEKISTGEFTYSEICRRLEMAIEAELQKLPEEMDMPFIRASQDLLYTIHTGREYVSNIELRREEMKKRIEHSMYARKRNRRFVAVVGVVAALFVFLFIGDGVLRREWLSGVSTPDEQQFEVAGNVIDPGLVEGGKADNGEGIFEISTSNFDEAVSVLGYIPLVPAWVPAGWEVMEYYAFSEDEFSRFSMDMTSEYSDEKLKYETMRYSDMEAARFGFEQNEHGNMTPINNREVYLTTNVERSAAIWLNGNTTYSIFGPIGEDDIIRMINSM